MGRIGTFNGNDVFVWHLRSNALLHRALEGKWTINKASWWVEYRFRVSLFVIFRCCFCYLVMTMGKIFFSRCMQRVVNKALESFKSSSSVQPSPSHRILIIKISFRGNIRRCLKAWKPISINNSLIETEKWKLFWIQFHFCSCELSTWIFYNFPFQWEDARRWYLVNWIGISQGKSSKAVNCFRMPSQQPLVVLSRIPTG